jgi:hypothetical protein
MAELIVREQAQSPAISVGIEPDDTHELPYYIVPSDVFFGVIRGQINKFCVGFEFSLWGSNKKYTKWEQTQAAIIFLRALRHSFGTSPIQQESLLWKDSWARHGRFQSRRRRLSDGTIDPTPTHHEGLSMSVAVQRCGIGWFAPKFDWTVWQLKNEHANLILMENPRMVTHYWRRRGAINDVKDIYTHLQRMERLMDRYNSASGNAYISDHMISKCIQQFRADVFKHLVNDLHEDVVDAATAGRLPLCYHTIADAEVMINGPPWFVSGNKLDIKDPETLFEYLFDWQAFSVTKGAKTKEKQRLHWDSLPFRVLFHKSYLLLKDRLGRAEAQRWRKLFKASLLLSNTLLPFPDYNTFFSRTKSRPGRGQDTEQKTRRCWMAIWIEPRSLIQELTHHSHDVPIAKLATRFLKAGSAFMGGQSAENLDVDESLPPVSATELTLEQWLDDEFVDSIIQSSYRAQRE